MGTGFLRYSTMEEGLQRHGTLPTGARQLLNCSPSTSIRRLGVVDHVAISTYEHEGSQSAAVIASIKPKLCDDLLAQSMMEKCFLSSVHTTTRSNAISIETLSRNWSIPLERAKRTLTVTTQRGVRTRPATLTRRFRTNDRMLRYQRLRTTMFTDTLEAGTLSRRQNRYAQVFVIPPNWTKVYSMKNKSDAHHCLSSLFHDVGVPERKKEGEFRKKLRDAG
jgi:hypothetical protein